jgi:hypothetical protein
MSQAYWTEWGVGPKNGGSAGVSAVCSARQAALGQNGGLGEKSGSSLGGEQYGLFGWMDSAHGRGFDGADLLMPMSKGC